MAKDFGRVNHCPSFGVNGPDPGFESALVQPRDSSWKSEFVCMNYFRCLIDVYVFSMSSVKAEVIILCLDAKFN